MWTRRSVFGFAGLSVARSMPNISFKACSNTPAAMSKREGKQIEILPVVSMVPAGVVTLVELNEAGWTLLCP